MLGISGHLQQGRRRSLKQESKEDFLVLPHQRHQGMRNAEDQVIIAHRQQLALPSAEPLLAGVGLALRTVTIAAGAVRGGFVAATNTSIAMAAERCSSAALDGGEDFELHPAQRLAVAFDKSGSCPADNIGHLEGWPCHNGLSSAFGVWP